MKTVHTKYIIWFAVILFALTVLLPLLNLIFNSLFLNDNFSVIDFLGVFQGNVIKSIINSLVIALAVSLFSVMLGCGFAFLFVKTQIPFKKLLRALLLLPLFLPPYIVAVAWNDTFLYLNISKEFIYSISAVILILTTVYVPLATFIISGSLYNVASSIEEAGIMLTGYKTVFFRVILPLIRPSIFSSFLLIFILTLSEFAIPSYLSVKVFTTEIFTQFTAFYNYSTAIAQSLILTIICLLMLLPEWFYLSHASFISFGKKSTAQKFIILKKPIRWTIIVSAYILLLVIVPILMLLAQTSSINFSAFIEIIQHLLSAIYGSLLLSSLGALTITIIGFIFAIISVKYNFKVGNYILLFVFAIPPIVIGISLTKFYNTPLLNFIYGSGIILLIALAARYVFIAQKILSNGLLQIPNTYYESAILMGATPFIAFTKISLPLLAESLYTSFFITLIFCIGELTTVIMIYPPGIALLPVKIFTRMANSPQNNVSCMCLISMVIIFFLIIFMMSIKNLLINQRWMKNQS